MWRKNKSTSNTSLQFLLTLLYVIYMLFTWLWVLLRRWTKYVLTMWWPTSGQRCMQYLWEANVDTSPFPCTRRAIVYMEMTFTACSWPWGLVNQTVGKQVACIPQTHTHGHRPTHTDIHTLWLWNLLHRKRNTLIVIVIKSCLWIAIQLYHFLFFKIKLLVVERLCHVK